ncbi:hypothetical protein Cgig2_027290 [Carnegiea gigantea]|uniref:DUF3615 domain-containing protein n=1 Tax=Carnegiea gigantea TaxID=171969 RepID=A0A9Q1K3C8_9CARY|nr:hypothetical protein Cgig2_027290 [Carnegiea gigantea]
MEGGNSGGGDRACRYDLRSNKTWTLKRTAGAQVLETPSSPKRIKENSKSLEFEKLCREYVEIALKFFNKAKHAKKVGEYELVEVGDFSGFDRGMEGFWYHTNFKANPKNAPEAEAELFFAELNDRYPQLVKCVKCCILGPIDSDSKGCKACEKFFLKLCHPQDGFHIGFPPHLIANRPTKSGWVRILLRPSPLLRVLALDLMLAKHSTAIASRLIFLVEYE